MEPRYCQEPQLPCPQWPPYDDGPQCPQALVGPQEVEEYGPQFDLTCPDVDVQCFSPCDACGAIADVSGGIVVDACGRVVGAYGAQGYWYSPFSMSDPGFGAQDIACTSECCACEATQDCCPDECEDCCDWDSLPETATATIRINGGTAAPVTLTQFTAGPRRGYNATWSCPDDVFSTNVLEISCEANVWRFSLSLTNVLVGMDTYFWTWLYRGPGDVPLPSLGICGDEYHPTLFSISCDPFEFTFEAPYDNSRELGVSGYYEGDPIVTCGGFILKQAGDAFDPTPYGNALRVDITTP